MSNSGPVLKGEYMHQIVTFLAVTSPYDSNWLCTGFVVPPVESENLIVFCTAVREKNRLLFRILTHTPTTRKLIKMDPN